MNKFGIFCLASAGILLASCGQDPVEAGQSTNGNITVGLLFEYDNCKVYRFRDAGKYIYFSKCLQPSQVSWSDTTSTGKSSTTTARQVNTELAME